jgi:hypothetical protein
MRQSLGPDSCQEDDDHDDDDDDDDEGIRTVLYVTKVSLFGTGHSRRLVRGTLQDDSNRNCDDVAVKSGHDSQEGFDAKRGWLAERQS